MKKANSTWISESQFAKIKVGDELTFKYMIGKNKVTKTLYKKNKYNYIKVNFIDGPWAKKNEIEIIRQQINGIK